MKPKFKHDCEGCTFHGHMFGYDIYTCTSSIIARWGDEGSQYASTDISLFLGAIKRNDRIGGHNDDGSRWTMDYRDYLFSDKVIDYHKAWLLVLAQNSDTR